MHFNIQDSEMCLDVLSIKSFNKCFFVLRFWYDKYTCIKLLMIAQILNAVSVIMYVFLTYQVMSRSLICEKIMGLGLYRNFSKSQHGFFFLVQKKKEFIFGTQVFMQVLFTSLVFFLNFRPWTLKISSK